MAELRDTRFRQLVDQAPDAFVLVDEDRIILYVNAFAERLYGWDRDELVGRHIETLVPERFRAVLAGMDTSTIKPGGRLGAGIELSGLQKDGGEFPVEINMMAIEGDRGILVASVVRDVTQRRLIEKTLAASEAKFRRLVEGLEGDYFFTTLSLDGTLTYLSPSVEAILGYTSEEVGKDFRLFLSEHSMNQQIEAVMEREASGDRPPPYDVEVRCKDGSKRIVEISDTLVRDRADQVVAVESINRDVTKLRAAERELRVANQRFDRLLRQILPHPIVDELAQGRGSRPRRHENVAVLFCDLVGFTAYCDTREPEEVVNGLGRLIHAFEGATERHGLQKIKTIGDAYMAAAGLLQPLDNPVESAVRCGLEFVELAARHDPPWEARVGVHVGHVVAGMMGSRQFGYDLWGDTVNTAARMEGFSSDGRVALSRAAWGHVESLFRATPLGLQPVKGKGEIEVFLVEGERED